MKLDLRERPSPKRCAVCRDEDDGHLTACTRCGVEIHLECVTEAKCPTIGCVKEKEKKTLRAILEDLESNEDEERLARETMANEIHETVERMRELRRELRREEEAERRFERENTFDVAARLASIVTIGFVVMMAVFYMLAFIGVRF